MIDHQEPQRLFDSPDAPAELRSLLVRAHQDVPSAAEKQQLVRAALGQRAAPRAPVHGRGSSMRWAARAVRRAPRWWSIAAVVGVSVGALYVAGVGRPQKGPDAPRPAARTASVTHAEIAPIEAPAPVLAVPPDATSAIPSATGASVAPAGGNSGAVASAAPQVTEARAGAAAARPLSRPRAHRRWMIAAATAPKDTAVRRASGEARPDPAPPFDVAEREASPAATAPPSKAAAPEASVREAPPQAPPVDQSDEASLLRSARRALARSPERTLSLTNEHINRYPHGILDQEREALAIEALIKLERLGEARQRARAFAVTYPASPHRARLERALLKPSESGAAP